MISFRTFSRFADPATRAREIGRPPNVPMQVVSTGLRTSQSAALALPATAAGTIFTVTGHIWVQAIYLIVTTVIQAQATTVKWSAKVGTLTAVDVSNATADLKAAAVGQIFIPGPTFAPTASNNANGALIAAP